MNELAQLSLLTLGVVFGLMWLLWVVSLVKRDASIVDPFWGAGFAVVAWVAAAWHDFQGPRTLLLVGLTTAWGLRLSLHLLIRNRGEGEDYRYRAMRDKHGPRFWWVSGFTVFGLQAAIMWIVSWPIQFGGGLTTSSSPGLGWLDFAGLAVWLIGFAFESVGDYQLAKFKSDAANRGRVLDSGLWRYTRHPNYFGDFCVWWGLFLVAAGGGAWWTILSPLLMSFLLIKVSGVSMLEKTISNRRPEYEAYIRRTSAFFPWPPKRPQASH